MITLAFRVSEPDRNGVKRFQWEGALTSGEMTVGRGVLRAGDFLPFGEGKNFRYRKVTVGFLSNTDKALGIGITPILYHSNQFSAIYLSTQYTNPVPIDIIESTWESTLEWDSDFFIRMTDFNPASSVIEIYAKYAAIGTRTDEIYVHVAGEVW